MDFDIKLICGFAKSMSPPKANPIAFANLSVGEYNIILQLYQSNAEFILH